jgi:hypothetical protein
MLVAREYMGSVDIGITAPQFFRANDNNVYIVKLQNNRLGCKVLVNEFVAARLGKRLGLSFPPSDIIAITAEIWQHAPCPLTTDISLGWHFASRYLEHTEYVGKLNLAQASNITDMAGILLFDHMFHNGDRTNNRRNILLQQQDSDYKLYAIDNSHLFRSGKWTLESIRSLGTRIKVYTRYTFGLLLKDYLSPPDFLPYLANVAQCSDQELDSIVSEIPSEWLADQDERQALAQHLKLRRDLAPKIWRTLCGYIPKARGGHRWL